MPLTTTGRDVMENMKETYGSEKKAKRVFYASLNKGKPGSSKWHRKRKARARAVKKLSEEND